MQDDAESYNDEFEELFITFIAKLKKLHNNKLFGLILENDKDKILNSKYKYLLCNMLIFVHICI